MKSRSKSHKQAETGGQWAELDTLLGAGVGEVYPGCAVIVGEGGRARYRKCFGDRQLVPQVLPASIETVYDIASLTKALATTTLAMRLVQGGELDLDWRLSEFFKEFAEPPKSKISVRHLLNHSSGLPAHRHFYREIDRTSAELAVNPAPELILQAVLNQPLERAVGSSAVYSDLGFILLGEVISRTFGLSLAEAVEREIAAPLGLTTFSFRPAADASSGDNIAATEQCPFRKRMIVGEVDDQNAWAMGGVAGHAGIFSNADDVFQIAKALLDSWHERSGFVRSEIVKGFWTREEIAGDDFALGWATRSAEKSSSGALFSSAAVGHLGYTGCSIWIEPATELVVVLLTNAIHPTAPNKKIKEFRPKVHDVALKIVGAN